jgi:SAM-dependent methyltransferase
MTTIEAPPAELDMARVEAFGGELLGTLNRSLTALMISVGHRTGLYDTLAALPPSTSAEIARAAGLNERYVREWLAAMTTAGIVEYHAEESTFQLPAEHAMFLTRAAGPDNLAYLAQYVSELGRVEDGIVECFKNGGGLSYAAYPNFQVLQRGESAAIYDASLLQRTLPAIPGLVPQLEAGIDVADFGCGAGHAVNLMARAFPASRFSGFDFSEDGIAIARAEAADWGLSNVSFEVRDVAELERPAAFDLITAFDSIHDQVHPRTVLANIRRALRPGGTFLMADIAGSSHLQENLEHPLGPAFYAVSTFHCMTVSLSAGGEGLGTMWGEQTAREYLANAGFTIDDALHIEGDISNVYFICR